jgi:cytochrome c oxidase cbb3-type subunit III
MRPQERPHRPSAGKSFSALELRETRPAYRTLKTGFSAGCVLLLNLQLHVAQPRTQGTSRPAPQGQAIFSSACASCHGLDGRGSERAPNIAQKPELQHLSDEAVVRIIEEGVPGTGMPAFRSLPTPDAKAVVAYLRILQGASKPVDLPGNPERGRKVFFGKGMCSECHMVSGSGGFIASDLSDYARIHSVEEARSAITTPPPFLEGRAVLATTHDGQKYTGRLRNEDNFSVQLQTLDGAFHFLSKADLAGLESDSRNLMPSDYGSTLSATELDDLASYLVSSHNPITLEPVTGSEE